jgi:predicted TIM-barrel fold metal-dependent hydrolase
MWSAADELEMFRKIPLTDEERRRILGENLIDLIVETDKNLKR